eukprot:gene29529-5876_t
MAHFKTASSSGFGVLNRGLQRPGFSISANTPALVDQANTKGHSEYGLGFLGPSEEAVKLLTKQPSMFGKRPTSIHAKLLMLEELIGCSPSLMLTRNVSIVTRSMHTRIGPRCILLRELGLAEDENLMYRSTWGAKTNSNFATWPTLLKAYKDMGRERFPTTNNLEDAIVVCNERWDHEWKAKFDERSLMMKAEWMVTGIVGLPTIGNLICKEDE